MNSSCDECAHKMFSSKKADLLMLNVLMERNVQRSFKGEITIKAALKKQEEYIKLMKGVFERGER